MTDLFRMLGVAAASSALGWTAFFSFVVAPQAFRDLDAGRAKRFVRNAMKTGHPIVAGISGASALAGLASGAAGGAVVMGLAAALYLMAAWTLAPREDRGPPPGGRRKLDTARVVASLITALIMLVALAGAGMIALGV